MKHPTHQHHVNNLLPMSYINPTYIGFRPSDMLLFSHQSGFQMGGNSMRRRFMEKKMMKSNGAGSRSSAMKRRRLLSAAAVLLICCLAFVGAVGAAYVENCEYGDSCTIHDVAVGTIHYDTLSEVTNGDLATDDSIVKVLHDIVLSSAITITKDNLTIVGRDENNPPLIKAKPRTDDGKPKSYVYEMFIVKNNVTFQNLKFENAWTRESSKVKYNGKCILISNGGITVDIINCNFEMGATKGNPTPIGISNTGVNNKPIVNLSGIQVTTPKGYAIFVTSPVILNIKDNSDISGFGALVFAGDSTDTTVTISDSKISGRNTATSGKNSFGTIVFNDDGISVGITNSIIETHSEGNPQISALFSYRSGSSDNKNQVTVSGGELVVSGTGCVTLYFNDVTAENAKTTLSNVISNTDISEHLDELNYVCVSDGAGKYNIVEKRMGLSVTPTELTLSPLTEGYAQPTGQSITLENTGNAALTLKVLTDSGDFIISGLESEQVLGAESRLAITITPKTALSVGEHVAEIIIDTLDENIEGEGNVTAKVTASFTVNPQMSDDDSIINSNSGSCGSSSGNYLSFPRTTTNGGLVDFGSSKVIKAVLLPEGSSGSVLLKVDTVEKWPKALDTEYTFDISVEKLGDGMAYIHFEIPVSTLESLELTPADICAYHFEGEVWTKLPTTYEVKDGTVCCEAETDSFSPFKLVIEEGAATQKEGENVPTVPPTDEPDVPDEPEILPPIDEPTKPAEPETPAPILAVLAGLGAAVIVRRK